VRETTCRSPSFYPLKSFPHWSREEDEADVEGATRYRGLGVDIHFRLKVHETRIKRNRWSSVGDGRGGRR
jgi:hypothetical protein